MNTFELQPVPPFRLVPTVRMLQRMPANRVDVLEGDRYFRVLPAPEGLRLVVAEDTGTVDAPRVHVTVEGGGLQPAGAASLRATLSDMLGMEVDLTRFYDVAFADPHLRDVALALRGLKPPHFPALFETLVNTVVFQQISLSAAVTIVGRFVERFGQSCVVGGRRYLAFPEPDVVVAASDAELRSPGLSPRKAEVLRNLAGLVLSGDLSLETLRPLPDEEAIRMLDALPGIGLWTAQLILLRGLGRLSVFPSGDVGARRGLARLLGREQPLTAADEQQLLARYGDQRGMVYFFNLGWRLLQMGLIEPAAALEP